MNKSKNKLKFISYDGAYPNLCSGQLIMKLDGKEIIFPEYCLSSGGAVWFDDDSGEHVDNGEWSINIFPEGFPKELKQEAERLVNSHIEQGCCGGCI